MKLKSKLMINMLMVAAVPLTMSIGLLFSVNIVDTQLLASTLIVGTILLSVLIAFILSKKISHQISSIRDVVDSITRSKWDSPLPAGDCDEVRDLTKSLSIMIAEVKQREKSHRESEERFALALKGTNDGIWDWNILANGFYFSPGWKSMLGYDVNEFEDSFDNFAAHLHPEDSLYVKDKIDAYLSERKDKFEVELRLRHKEGHYVDVLSRGYAVRRETDNVPVRFVGTHKDISERKRMEIALVELKNEAEVSSNAKKNFLSSMSHELRTPLNAILGFAQLIEIMSREEITRDNSQEIINAGNHLLNLIEEILDLSKIESGNIDISLEKCCLDKILNNTVALITPLAEKKSIQIDNRVSTSFNINVDKMRFKQVLLNILSNAIKYNSENGKVIIDSSTENNMLCLSITDTGKGFTAEQLSHLFEPFERFGAVNSNIEGAGLGLLIANDLIVLMGGTITVESTYGKGSCFVIQIPISLPVEVAADNGRSIFK